jgi:photosystem II stability/assembly factor-like uncharacterized protein
LLAQAAVWNSLGPAGSYVRVVKLDPTNPNTVYAALVYDQDHPIGGVLKSSDGGNTWNPANNGLPPNSSIYAVAMIPSNSSTLYLGIDNYGTPSQGVYKSTDAGTSWNPLSLPQNWGYLSIAVNPSNPSVVFAGSDGWGMFMSVDGGNNWVPPIMVYHLLSPSTLSPLIRTIPPQSMPARRAGCS